MATASYHRATIRTPRRKSPTSSAGRGALHRRSAALRAPTTPAEEAAFLAEFEKIEAESDQVEVAYESVSRELRVRGQLAGKA